MPESPPRRLPAVSPTQDDSLLAALRRGIGGPVGAHTVPGRSAARFFTPFRVLILLTTLAAVVAVLQKSFCRINGWGQPDVYFAGCYSDWTALYAGRGLAENALAPFADGSTFEYPVLAALVASMTAMIAQTLPSFGASASLIYFDVNFLFVFALWVVTVIVTARSAGRRYWDAAMVAVAPGIILAGSINWDMWAVALMMLGMWLFGGGKPGWAGVMLGLGAAMKVFPMLLLGALLILAVRSLRFAPLAWTVLGAVVAWLVVNLPLMIANPEAWSLFYTFSSERPPGWSSIWQIYNEVLPDGSALAVTGASLGTLSVVSFVLCCGGIFLLGVLAPHRPRFAQLALLIVAAFILCNKVYSPQFVLWLVPLVALALPNWRDFLIWQLAEVLHFFAIWAHLSSQVSGHENVHQLDSSIYVMAVLAHVAATVYLMVRVVQQILRPEDDPVRRSLPAQSERPTTVPVGTRKLNATHWDPGDLAAQSIDDPQGGPYDGAADRAPWLIRSTTADVDTRI
ncbi:glycosyltransferase family 87 protein [Citricoccus sp. NR2]|uniref:glycosyltransferase family 87 protein n=1 Tax=Citricoccus sp. NR2 TaxID=3004095 RepID=UPI0022DCF85F|nr:glycosyltransferase 87 family protein [Citricoccus sp. NR2]WBL19924.1 glycosyltransferase 87 family protein [Citricoccus sp. NR2]